jgi:hypothetical protein
MRVGVGAAAALLRHGHHRLVVGHLGGHHRLLLGVGVVSALVWLKTFQRIDRTRSKGRLTL